MVFKSLFEKKVGNQKSYKACKNAKYHAVYADKLFSANALSGQNKESQSYRFKNGYYNGNILYALGTGLIHQFLNFFVNNREEVSFQHNGAFRS